MIGFTTSSCSRSKSRPSRCRSRSARSISSASSDIWKVAAADCSMTTMSKRQLPLRLRASSMTLRPEGPVYSIIKEALFGDRHVLHWCAPAWHRIAVRVWDTFHGLHPS
jgi:hypothetical protein